MVRSLSVTFARGVVSHKLNQRARFSLMEPERNRGLRSRHKDSFSEVKYFRQAYHHSPRLLSYTLHGHTIAEQ